MNAGILNGPGENFLNNMVKDMCTEGGIDGKYTNHSLRATGASELFQSETSEHVIQQFTGHRSVQALRQYENILTKQKQAACNILTGSSEQSFSSEAHKVTGMQKSSTCVAPYSKATFTMPTSYISSY